MLSKKKRDNDDDNDDDAAVDSRQIRIMNLVYEYVFIMIMKSEISFVWQALNLTNCVAMFFISFISAFYLIVLFIKEKRKLFNILSSHYESPYISCHIVLCLLLLSEAMWKFLIRFKDRQLSERSVLQAYVYFIYNEKIKKAKEIVFKTLSAYSKDLCYTLAHSFFYISISYSFSFSQHSQFM